MVALQYFYGMASKIQKVPSRMEAAAANLLDIGKTGSLGRTGRFIADPGAFQTAICSTEGGSKVLWGLLGAGGFQTESGSVSPILLPVKPP